MLSAPPPSCTCTLYRSTPATTMAHAHSKRSTKFEPRLTKRLTRSIEKNELMCELRARALHLKCAPLVSFLYSVVMPL